jgi:hypothetical protein
MSDRLRISNTWGKRFTDQKIALPALLRRAGLPVELFEQEKVYLTTAQLFALWQSVGETSSDPAIGLKLGSETRLARSHPAGIAVLCSRTFEDALQRLARYKQLTCPEEIRVERGEQEASVEFFYVEATEPQPALLVDMVLSWILSVGRHGTNGLVTPPRVDLARPAKHRSLLESHFGCRVHFKADRNALIGVWRTVGSELVALSERRANSPNRYMFSSLPLQMAFFPFDQVETISPRPILMIVGGKADTKFWSDEVYAKAQEPKELFVVDGATHI